jgi:hypothetical protein
MWPFLWKGAGGEAGSARVAIRLLILNASACGREANWLDLDSHVSQIGRICMEFLRTPKFGSASWRPQLVALLRKRMRGTVRECEEI